MPSTLAQQLISLTLRQDLDYLDKTCSLYQIRLARLCCKAVSGWWLRRCLTTRRGRTLPPPWSWWSPWCRPASCTCSPASSPISGPPMSSTWRGWFKSTRTTGTLSWWSLLPSIVVALNLSTLSPWFRCAALDFAMWLNLSPEFVLFWCWTLRWVHL